MRYKVEKKFTLNTALLYISWRLTYRTKQIKRNWHNSHNDGYSRSCTVYECDCDEKIMVIMAEFFPGSGRGVSYF